ncbi:MAG TPA: TatD family hydrolase [Nevskiaceae bacterium]|nr:TatD family hydrolase [Nevskiaceae bacterium]
MIDIGANLAHESFAADREAVLARAWAAGLEAIIVTGSCYHSALAAIELSRAHPQRLWATVGLHPHHAEDWNAELAARFAELATQPQVVSLGECGLDYFRDLAPRPRQRAAFSGQLELAVARRLPLFLHQREAHADFLAILREYRAALGPVVVHCFTDQGAALDDYLALDCHIGITGWICDERRGGHLRALLPRIPAARLMVESDAPYLLPRNLPRDQQPRDRRRNEPAFLPWVVQACAEARGEPAGQLAASSTETARGFFRLPAP